MCAPRASAFLQTLRDALSDTREIQSNAWDIPHAISQSLFFRDVKATYIYVPIGTWMADSRL